MHRKLTIACLTTLGLLCVAGYAKYSHDERSNRERRLEEQVKQAMGRAERAERAANAAARSAAGLTAIRTTAEEPPEAHAVEPAVAKVPLPSRPAAPERASSPEEELAQSEAYMGKLDELMRAEPRDNAWSNDVETSVTNMYKDRGFTKSHVQRVECRQTLCRMEASHDDGAAYDDWLRRFPEGHLLRGVLQHTPILRSRSHSGFHRR